jgi:hypothetical protein
MLHEGAHESLWYACSWHKTPLHKPLPPEEVAPVCERCGDTEGITWTVKGPSYVRKISCWEYIRFGLEGPPDPNRSYPFCPSCREEYEEGWAEMWQNYYNSCY